jgi:hypothetical protein
VTLLYYAQWKIAVKKLLPEKTVSVTGLFGGADEKNRLIQLLLKPA